MPGIGDSRFLVSRVAPAGNDHAPGKEAEDAICSRERSNLCGLGRRIYRPQLCHRRVDLDIKVMGNDVRLLRQCFCTVLN